MEWRQIEVAGPWPTLFELEIGESVQLKTGSGTSELTLLAVEHHTEPDYWTNVSPKSQIYTSATITVRLDGARMELVCRPAQLPVTVGPVRLYVETTYEWAHRHGQIRPIDDVGRAVRFSVVEAGAPWGPADLVFPIAQYRWRSSTYQNTWCAQVPFNTSYYHRGEDLGAIPDRLPVLAARDAVVVDAPRRDEPKDSNPVILDVGDGVQIRYAHMNIERIRSEIVPGGTLNRGEQIGLTGETHNGWKAQHDDPHLHVDLSVNGTKFSPYPSYIESYFRTYPDQVLAVAGGFGYTLPGHTYRLDGTRSVARPGTSIVDYEWRLHDGSRVSGPVATVRYDRPGYYSEELIVRTADGAEDRDAMSVRVYEPFVNPRIGRGWAYYAPTRGIRPGTTVEFWSRLHDVDDVTIDFGDGALQAFDGDDETTHAYDQPGLYTVAIHGAGPGGEPVTVKMRVCVEP